MLNYNQHLPLIQKHYWHSSAHILGSAIEKVFPEALLTHGPAIKEGFFYDFYSPENKVVSQEDYAHLLKHIKSIVDQKHLFERLEVTKEEALDLFSYNRFKTELIAKKIPDGAKTSVYRIGDFVDLCTGPHIPHTGHAAAFDITKHSGAYWLGDSNNASLQRIYGISFPKKDMLEKHR